MLKKYIRVITAVLIAIMAIATSIKVILPAKEKATTVSKEVVFLEEDHEKEPVTVATAAVTETIGMMAAVSSNKEALTEVKKIEEFEDTELAEIAEEDPVPTSHYDIFSEEEIVMMAKLLYGEANCVEEKAERAMVIWTVLNRYDSEWFGDTISEVITAPMQFTGYSYDHPVTERNLSLVYDVVERYAREKAGEENVGRVLPSNIFFFHSDSGNGSWHNAFYRYSNGLAGDRIYFDRDNPPSNPY